jgi:hypothetical protein
MSDGGRAGETWEPVDPPAADAIERPRASLAAVRRLADGWLLDNLDRFDPFAWSASEERELRRKAFTEFALNLYVARGVGAGYDSSAPHDLVVDRVNDRRYRHLLRRSPRDLLKYSYPVTYARASDDLDGATVDAVDAVLDGRTVWSVERVPYRQMDLWHFCRLYGYDDHSLDRETLLALGSLAHPPNVANASLGDLYAVTHNVYYHHNFGVDHPAFPDGVAPYDLEPVVVGGLLRFVAADNPDIVLELLLTGVLQRQVPPALVRLVLAWVRERGARAGRLPGPDEEPVEMPSGELESWEPEDREWARHYHTNLVGATATRAIAARPDWPALAEPPTGAADRAAFVDLHRLGQVLDALASYDLEVAARRVTDLADTSFDEPYATVRETAVEYLRRQRTRDGDYGFWTDEAAVFEARGGDRETFRERLVEPVTEACSRAVRKTSAGEPGSSGRPDAG